MFSNVALDVFIGLVFIFLLYSLLATIIQEIIATRFAFRAKVLEKAILRMLEDGKTSTKLQYGDRIQGVLHLFGLLSLLKGKKVAPWFYAHPLIKYLAEDNYYSKPAYLNAENFSKVMVDLLKGFGFPESQAVQSIHNSIMEGTIYKLPINLVQEDADAPRPDKANPAIKVLREQKENMISNDLLQYERVKMNRNTALYLKSLWQESGADVTLFSKKLEAWFDDTMERATGWYKRYTRIILFSIGVVLAVAFNVDTIAIHRILSKDKDARGQLVQLAIKSQDQLATEVERQHMGTATSDTILQNTYNLIAQDANQANSILGLGRVWSDTCKMCDDSTKNGVFRKLDSLKVDTIYKQVNTLSSILKDLYYERDSIVIKFKDKPDTLALKTLRLEREIVKDSTQLVQYSQDPLLKEYERIKAFKARCEFIKASIGKKWFVFAPGQAGNWETLFGWLITALAVMLGAPFWFDLLSKLVKIRGAGTKVEGSDPNEKTTDPATTQTAPMNVTVNSNSGEEAVG
ncbi:MAG TPA: hypothetical protein VNT20_01065 [Flavisolibacter sp.]|nr:hypothetical protein [Flavisolibacter sp.]